MRLHSVKFGLAGGILWGVSLFVMTILSIYTGWAMFWLSQWMDIYPWFDFSFGGAIMGMICGFIDGFVTLFLLSWIYNRFKP